VSPRYLDLAKFFIDQRGQNIMKGHRSYGPEYHQDHIPVRQVVEAAGHAVRQLYLASGVTDLYMETGEQALLDAMLRLSKDIIETKLYITGGLGARFDGEAFGDPYELPADQCYCETCAAIASLMWNWRMLLDPVKDAMQTRWNGRFITISWPALLWMDSITFILTL
jgi:DUF1680 family protein